MKTLKNQKIPTKIILKNNLEIRLVKLSELKLLKEAFEMTYKVYINEKKYLTTQDLSSELNNKKQFYDKFDFTENTKHIIAIKDNKVVGRARYTDGIGPISEDFNFKPHIKNDKIRYISRILTNPTQRQSMSVLLGLCNYLYQTSRDLNEFFCSSFEHGVNFYKGLGAINLGEFKNSQFPNGKSYAFKWDVDKLESNYKNQEGVKTRFVEEMIKPIEIKWQK